MKKILFLILIAATMTVVSSCNKKGAGTTPTEDSVSAILGKGYGTQMASQASQAGEQIDKDEFLAGFQAAFDLDTTKADMSYGEGLMTGAQLAQQVQQLEEQMGVKINKRLLYNELAEALKKPGEPNMDQLQALGMKMQSLMQKAQLEAATKVGKQGNEYTLKAMAADKELKKTATGLVYKIEKQGNGKLFKQGDKVMVKYRGTHTDGRVFDEAKKAVALTVDDQQMIRGFVEVLKLMSPGAKAHVIIPGNLAYGPNGNQGGILPNETLVFDIETGNLATPAQVQQGVKEQGMSGQPGMPVR